MNMLRKKIKLPLLIGVVLLLALSLATAVIADKVVNTLDNSADTVAETMALNINGTPGVTELYLVLENKADGDTKNGCNLTGQTIFSVSISSSNPQVATAALDSSTFTSCADRKTVTVTPVGLGETTITLTQTANNTGGTFNLAPATFVVDVAPPLNRAPVIEISGVMGGASYEFGGVPEALCTVTDAEDGVSYPQVFISAVSGDLAQYGLGQQSVSCSYTDAGGLFVESSVTYNIVDTTAPQISLLSRSALAGEWTNQNVSVVWSCYDDVSGTAQDTVSQVVSGEGAGQSVTGECVDRAGNRATNTQLGINIDKSAPQITYAGRTPANAAGWNNGSVTLNWTCADALSGAAQGAVSQVVAGQGQNQSATGVCADRAGNTASDTREGINIDLTAPALALTSRTPANPAGWNNTPVELVWSCSDVISGVAVAPQPVTLSGEGANQQASASCADVAGNQSSQTVTGIHIDMTAPVISDLGPTAPANGANGWYTSPVSNTFEAADGLSGFAGQPDPYQITVSTGAGEGPALVISSGAVSDRAGNTAAAIDSAAFSVDLSAPQMALLSRTPANGFGWNNGPVTVEWSCADSVSGVVSGTVSQTASSQGAGQSVSGVCANLAGLETTLSEANINIDTTAPSISLTSRTPANSFGWNNTDVTVTWSCADELAGVVDDTLSQTLSAELAGQSASGECADQAGNTASDEVSGINIDKTAPVMTDAGPTSQPNSLGWYNHAVANLFRAADNLSGIVGQANPYEFSVSTGAAEGSAVKVASGTVFDLAGNESNALESAPFAIDMTAPVITDLGPTAPANGLGGWYISAVSNTFRAADALSGFEGQANPYTFTRSSGTMEGGAVVISSGTVSDQAGNSATAIDSAAFKVDLSNPTDITFVGGPAEPTCPAEDAVSGLKSCAVSGYSTLVGEHTLTATATDNAGRTATATRSYTVLAWTINGFFKPVDMAGIVNTVKNGSTVPLKFEVFAGSVELTDTAVVTGFSKKVACSSGLPEDSLTVTATGSTVLRYDAAAGQFVFNWQTPKTPNTCYAVTVTTQDGASITASFKLK